MIEVTENDDKTFTISWDENDPQESIFNDFKEEDFINLIEDYLYALEESGEVDINQVTEAVNQINDHIEEEFFIDQTPEEVNQDLNTLHDWYTVKEEAIREYQSDEQSQSGTVPLPPNFPLFP